jgi:general stress protein CsbA
MTTPPLPQWCNTAPDAAFTAPAECSRQADRFARRIRIRNSIEYVTGALVIVLFSAASVGTAVKGEWLIALSLALIVGGTLVILRNLNRRGSNVERLPEEPCLTHLRRQYARQYAALRAVPAWYVGPLIPGCTLLYLGVAAGVAENAGWRTALTGIAQPAAITFGIFAAIALLNLVVARGLKRKLDALDRLA